MELFIIGSVYSKTYLNLRLTFFFPLHVDLFKNLQNYPTTLLTPTAQNTPDRNHTPNNQPPPP